MVAGIFIIRKVHYNVRLSSLNEFPYRFNQLFLLSLYCNFAEMMHKFYLN